LLLLAKTPFFNAKYRIFSVKLWHGFCPMSFMKSAIAVWNMRVAPVFDCARCFLVLEPGVDGTHDERRVTLPKGGALQFILNNGIERLVCGAISLESEQELLGRGIEVVSFVAGPLQDVLDAISVGALVEKRFSMPGCVCPRRRCARRGRGHGGWRQFSDE